MRDRSARGWFAFQRLRDHADRTQGPIVALLHKHNAAHDRLRLANAIVADCDRLLIEQLAGRPEVRAIESNAEQRWIEPDAIADVTPMPTVMRPSAIEWSVHVSARTP